MLDPARRRPIGAGALALAALLSFGTAPARADEPEPYGVRAPAGCWPMQGGCPSRSGESATEPIGGDVVEAWHYDLLAGWVIEEEPRVWNDRVVLAVRGPKSERALHAIHLSDGRPESVSKPWPTTEALEPVLDADSVLVRAAPDRLERWAIRGGKWTRLSAIQGTTSFDGAIPADGFVYVVHGSSVRCYSEGDDKPVWSADGEYRGRLALLGNWVYALQYDEAANESLVALNRHDGTSRGGAFCGHHGREGPPPLGYESDIVASPSAVFVQHGMPVKTKDGGRASTSRVPQLVRGDLPPLLLEASLSSSLVTPAIAGDQWITIDDDLQDGKRLLLWFIKPDTNESRFWPLADAKRHGEFLTASGISVAGTTAYVGTSAFDVESHRVTMDARLPSLFRPVPARERLLLVTAPDRLTALGPAPVGLHAPVFLGAAAPDKAVEAEGTVLFSDDALHVGPFSLDPAAGKIALVVGKKSVARPLTEVDVAFGKDGLLYARSLAGAGEALQRLVRCEHAAEFAKLAKDAYRTNDAKEMSRLIEEAASRGAAEKDLAVPRKEAADLAKRQHKVAEDVRTAILAREKDLLASERDRVLAALHAGLDDPRRPVRRSFLDLILDVAPDDPRSVEIVRSMIPAWLRAPADLKPSDWLDTADELQESKARPVDAPVKESPDLTPQQRELGSALHTWRKDLVGFQTDQMMVITPLVAPRRIASCLSMGELVCRALDGVFAEGKHVRTDPYPMILLLFETQDEYKKFSDQAFQGSSKGRLEWTAGHFDPMAGVSRIYLPPGPDAFRRVMHTYAHELTHHWIEERCPLYERRETNPRDDAPGYWIVEGMAEMVAEFRYDLAERTWDASNPRARAIDCVANATPEQLLPWETMFDTTGITFDTIDVKNHLRVPRRWELGWENDLSSLSMFYMQATATCFYLYSQGGATREALLQYVRGYYTGALRPGGRDGIRALFKLDPDALGAKVLEWCRATNQGSGGVSAGR